MGPKNKRMLTEELKVNPYRNLQCTCEFLGAVTHFPKRTPWKKRSPNLESTPPPYRVRYKENS